MVTLSDMDRAQLAATIDTYPWFAAARARLCVETKNSSGEEAAAALLGKSLAWLPDAGYVALRLRNLRERDFSDEELAETIRQTIKANPRPLADGGDYFTREEYASVRTEEDSEIRKFAIVDQDERTTAPAQSPDAGSEPPMTSGGMDIISETLAEIYADQGYADKAIEIYRKLSLQSTKKNAYFASLIENLQSSNK